MEKGNKKYRIKLLSENKVIDSKPETKNNDLRKLKYEIFTLRLIILSSIWRIIPVNIKRL